MPAERICGHESQQWRFNYSDEYSFPNFIEKLGLTCADKKIIGMVGGSYFLGFGISAGFLPRISDLYGRKVPLLIIMAV